MLLVKLWGQRLRNGSQLTAPGTRMTKRTQIAGQVKQIKPDPILQNEPKSAGVVYPEYESACMKPVLGVELLKLRARFFQSFQFLAEAEADLLAAAAGSGIKTGTGDGGHSQVFDQVADKCHVVRKAHA
jgi:hypothetical protein